MWIGHSHNHSFLPHRVMVEEILLTFWQPPAATSSSRWPETPSQPPRQAGGQSHITRPNDPRDNYGLPKTPGCDVLRERGQQTYNACRIAVDEATRSHRKKLIRLFHKPEFKDRWGSDFCKFVQYLAENEVSFNSIHTRNLCSIHTRSLDSIHTLRRYLNHTHNRYSFHTCSLLFNSHPYPLVNSQAQPSIHIRWRWFWH